MDFKPRWNHSNVVVDIDPNLGKLGFYADGALLTDICQYIVDNSPIDDFGSAYKIKDSNEDFLTIRTLVDTDWKDKNQDGSEENKIANAKDAVDVISWNLSKYNGRRVSAQDLANGYEAYFDAVMKSYADSFISMHNTKAYADIEAELDKRTNQVKVLDLYAMSNEKVGDEVNDLAASLEEYTDKLIKNGIDPTRITIQAKPRIFAKLAKSTAIGNNAAEAIHNGVLTFQALDGYKVRKNRFMKKYDVIVSYDAGVVSKVKVISAIVAKEKSYFNDMVAAMEAQNAFKIEKPEVFLAIKKA